MRHISCTNIQKSCIGEEREEEKETKNLVSCNIYKNSCIGEEQEEDKQKGETCITYKVMYRRNDL
jgi:hypothetical protein